MTKREIESKPGTVHADPTKWSKESQQCEAFQLVKEYEDIEYNCWRCHKPSVFIAKDQKYTFEVKKSYVWQRRVLCHDCWCQANSIKADIKRCEEQWATTKTALEKDIEFLSRWLHLLTTLEEYVSYKADTAKQNMLRKLIEQHSNA